MLNVRYYNNIDDRCFLLWKRESSPFSCLRFPYVSTCFFFQPDSLLDSLFVLDSLFLSFRFSLSLLDSLSLSLRFSFGIKIKNQMRDNGVICSNFIVFCHFHPGDLVASTLASHCFSVGITVHIFASYYFDPVSHFNTWHQNVAS